MQTKRSFLTKFTAFLLAFLLVLTQVPLAAMAANNVEDKPQLTSDVPISDVFPDEVFAEYIAGLLEKTVSDTVSQAELDTITSVNPSGAVHSVEGIEYLGNLTEARLDNLQLIERFPEVFVNDLVEGLNIYAANNQTYTSEAIYLSSASLGEVYPYIPSLFFQHVQYNPGEEIGTWYIENSSGTTIASFPARNGSELMQYEGLSDGNSYNIKLIQDRGDSWMGLTDSQYTFPIIFDTSNNPGSVEGYVTANGVGVKGATVTLYSSPQYTTLTDIDGHYNFASVKPGNYTVTAQAKGYQPMSKMANVTAKKTTTVNFELEVATNGSMVGRVIDAITKMPIEGATVAPEFAVEKQTDAQGQFYYANITTGEYTTSVSADGYEPTTDTRTVYGGVSSEAVIELTPLRYILSGVVNGSEDGILSSPLSGATVTLTMPDGTTQTTISTVDGSYFFTNLLAGNYVAEASKTGYSTEESSLTITNAYITQDFLLVEDAGNIVVNATMASSGLPVEGVKLDITDVGVLNTLIGHGNGKHAQTADTDAGGSYTFEMAPFHLYELTASKPGYKVDIVNLESNYTEFNLLGILSNLTDFNLDLVADLGVSSFLGLLLHIDVGEIPLTNPVLLPLFPNQTITVSVEVTPIKYTLQGTVYNESSTPIDTANVTVEQTAVVSEEYATATSEGSSQYMFTNVPAGTYEVTAQAAGYSTEVKNVTLPDDANDEGVLIYDFNLVNAPASLTGTVMYYGSNEPVENAELYLVYPSENVKSDKTDASGMASTAVAAGTYKAYAVYNGYTTPEQTVTVESGEVKNLSFYVFDENTVVGDITDAETGEKISGFTVSASQNDIEIADLFIDISEYEGFPYDYGTVSLTAGTYQLTVTAPGYQTETRDVVVTDTGELIIENFMLVPFETSIVGTVSYSDGTMIPDAEISIVLGDNDPVVTTTNNDGYYEFGGLTDAEYAVTANITTDSQTQNIEVLVGFENNLDFVFEKPVALGELEGYVTVNGIAASGVTVSAYKTTRMTESFTAVTDAEGFYDFPDLPAEEYDVVVVMEGYDTQIQHETILPEDTVELDFIFADEAGEDNGTLNGTVTLEDGGVAVVGATVVVKQGANTVATLTTDASGQYTTALAAGDYTVTVEFDGYVSQTKSAAVVAEDTVTVDFTLVEDGTEETNGTLNGTVTFEDGGEPVVGATVTVIQDNQTVATLTTNASGQYTTDLPAGDYTVTVEFDGYVSQTKSATVVAEDIETVDFELAEEDEETPTGMLDGTVTFKSNDNPVSGANVTIKSGATTVKTMQTAADGTYSTELSAGTYTVTVSFTGYKTQTKSSFVVSDDTTTVDFELEKISSGGGGGGGGGDEEYDFHEFYIYGYPEGTFMPSAEITRAEFISMVSRTAFDDFVEGERYDIGEGYADPNIEDHWAISAIEFATSKGIISGYENKYFYPNKTITREEVAVIIEKVVGSDPADSVPYTDADKISDWALDAVLTAYKLGIMTGDTEGTFRPREEITRAETVVVINTMLGRGVDSTGMGTLDINNWPDVPTTHWAYYQIAEASNSHEYEYRNGVIPPENWMSVEA